MATPGARQEKIGHIGTGDQQNQRHGTQQDQKLHPRIPDQLFLQGNHHRVHVRIRAGILLHEPLRNGLQFGLCFRHRDVGLHSPNRPILIRASGSDVLPAHIQWNPDVYVYRS
jgi:hypothetical protein